MSPGERGAAEPSSDGAIIEKLSGRVPRTAWRILARNEARAVFDQVREAEGRLPVYQALIRVPAGAAVSLAAVLLLARALFPATRPMGRPRRTHG